MVRRLFIFFIRCCYTYPCMRVHNCHFDRIHTFIQTYIHTDVNVANINLAIRQQSVAHIKLNIGGSRQTTKRTCNSKRKPTKVRQYMRFLWADLHTSKRCWASYTTNAQFMCKCTSNSCIVAAPCTETQA